MCGETAREMTICEYTPPGEFVQTSTCGSRMILFCLLPAHVFSIILTCHATAQTNNMNSENYKLCEKLIPSTYVSQGCQARRHLENKIRHLLEQVEIVTFKFQTVSPIIAHFYCFNSVSKWFYLIGLVYI